MISIICGFAKSQLIGNPFEVLGDGILINKVLLSPQLLGILIEPLLHVLSYTMVGLLYKERSAPALGSILYLIMYVCNSFILYVMSLFGLKIWSSTIIIFVYLFLFIMVAKIVNE